MCFLVCNAFWLLFLIVVLAMCFQRGVHPSTEGEVPKWRFDSYPAHLAKWT